MLDSLNIISVVVAILVIGTMYKVIRNSGRNYNRVLLISAITVFIVGVIIYMIGITGENVAGGVHDSFKGTRESFLAMFFRSILFSIGMFGFFTGYSNIGVQYQEDPLFMTVFASLHFIAAGISSLFALHYVFIRFRSWLNWQRIRLSRKPRRMHIFFDLEDTTRFLVKDIQTKPSCKDDILVIVENQASSSKDGAQTFASILNLFTVQKGILSLANETNAIIKRISKPIYKAKSSDFCNRLNMKWVVKQGYECYFYFLSENEDNNITAALKLTKDQTLESLKDKSKVRIYCHASKDGENSILERYPDHGIEIVIIDSAYLSVHELMSKEEAQPVNFVDISQDYNGLVTSQFTAMIIGFGETGQEALKFLYEFGQFIYHGHDEESDFHCHIVDRQLNKLKGRFLAKRPMLREHQDLFTWRNEDVRSSEFWENVHKNIDSLNYVVIATGSDADFHLALDLYDYARVNRRNGLEHFRIFIRVYEHINGGRLEELIRHSESHIQLFGKPSDIYTTNYIWEEEFKMKAAQFYLEYSKEIKAPLPQQKNGESRETYAMRCWMERHNQAKSCEDKDAFTDVLRMESQDLSNAYHIYTKLKLCGMKDGKDNVETAKTNIARLEHKRWIAAHEMMGYTRQTEDDYKKTGQKHDCLHKRHLCLTEWSQLPLLLDGNNNFQNYDSLVLTTSINIKKSNL